jgi:hypothetical protein
VQTAVPKVQELSSLKLPKTPSRQLVSFNTVSFLPSILTPLLGMYHGFDWYGRTLEVREVSLPSSSPIIHRQHYSQGSLCRSLRLRWLPWSSPRTGSRSARRFQRWLKRRFPWRICWWWWWFRAGLLQPRYLRRLLWPRSKRCSPCCWCRDEDGCVRSGGAWGWLWWPCWRIWWWGVCRCGA